MNDPTKLARAITRNGSKQAFFSIQFMVDKHLKDDAHRAYAYFRWVDDTIDETALSNKDRISFVSRQKGIINSLFNNGPLPALTPEEEIIVQLMMSRRGNIKKLKSYIQNMMAFIFL